MTIKKSFLLINALLLLIPVLTSIYLLSEERTRRGENVYYMHSMKSALTNYKPDAPEELRYFLPDTVEYIIYSDEKDILYSSSNQTEYEYLEYIYKSKRIRSNILKIDNGYIVVYSEQSNNIFADRRKPSTINFFTRPLLPSIISIIVVTFIAYIILRSLKKNILSLVEASKNISSGNLYYNIQECSVQELAPLHHSLEELKSELLTSRDKRARFIMGISHDLKTPLALINGYVEALSDRVYSNEDERNSYLTIIKDKSDELEGIISDLINLSRLDTGEWKYNLIEEDTGKLLSVLSEKYEADGKLKHINFSYIQKCSPQVVLDRKLIIRVLDNLFSNALKATPEGGSITLSLYNDSKNTFIEMNDTGNGIPKEDLPMIFEPFYKGSKSRTDTGHGLGLATVKTIISNHGWEIEALSPVNKLNDKFNGTMFRIII